MRLPRRYGESKDVQCPFCSKPAMSISCQKVPVCKNHVDAKLPEVKCACGAWTELREGKWGPFFLCDRCGPISFKKGIEMLKMMPVKEVIQIKTTAQSSAPRPAPKTVQKPTHQVVRSDDPRFFD